MTDTTDVNRTDVTSIVDAYLATWNEADDGKRAELVRTAWTEDGYYVDPLLEATGHDALAAMAPAVHQQFPGYVFERTSAVDIHHGHVRFGWTLASADDGAVAVAGLDVGLLADDGRLRYIAGFFGDLPALDA